MEEYCEVRALYYDLTEGPWDYVEFYVEHAKQHASHVLDLGCGTGRVAIPIAQAGIPVSGIDFSPHMLARAETRVAGLPDGVRRRITLSQGSMAEFDLDESFDLAIIPARSFNHVLCPKDQRSTFKSIHRHLRPGGRLAFDVFDAARGKLIQKTYQGLTKDDREYINPDSGNRVITFSGQISHDPPNQIEGWSAAYDEVDQTGKLIERKYSEFKTRYTFRYEMHYLLELCGFEVEDVFSDFTRRPYEGGSSIQLWLASKQ